MWTRGPQGTAASIALGQTRASRETGASRETEASEEGREAYQLWILSLFFLGLYSLAPSPGHPS